MHHQICNLATSTFNLIKITGNLVIRLHKATLQGNAFLIKGYINLV